MTDYTNCALCARECNLNRITCNTPCKSNNQMRIAKFGLYFDEEPCISGTKGSGAVFFTGCSLNCRFCQNYQISRSSCGKVIDENDLLEIFKKLQNSGAHNINLVNPTHFAPSIKSALQKYNKELPVIYNTHAYDSPDTIKSLNGLIDIYLPDIKYYNDIFAQRYSSAKDYFKHALTAVKLMCEQVKNTIGENNMLKKGVIIRHLILPGLTSDSIKILEKIKDELPPDITLSLMAQYTPIGNLKDYPELNRKITRREYDRVINKMISLDIKGYIQKLCSSNTCYIPQWDLL